MYIKKIHNFLKILKLIISSKIIFSNPQQKDILIWGVPLFILMFKRLNETSINFKKTNFIFNWGESYNLPILIKCLFKLKFSFVDYTNEFIKIAKPKIILSFLDIYEQFYMIKKDKNVKKILIQNSFRTNQHNMFSNKDYTSEKVDYVLCHNKDIGNKYRKLLGSKILVTGSFLSNHVTIKKCKKKYDVLFVSTLRLDSEMNCVIDGKVTQRHWHNAEIKLVKKIYQFTKENNYKLFILPAGNGRLNATKQEKEIYDSVLGKEKNWGMIERASYDYKLPYKVIDQAKVVLGIDSTLLYESFNRGNKTIFFDSRPSNKNLKKNRHFGYPKKFEKNGPFWISQDDLGNVKKIIKKVLSTSYIRWNKIKNKYRENFTAYDKNNETFNKLLKKYLNK